jgi:aminoglycoside phosphotransferase (APT) family kinase protein
MIREVAERVWPVGIESIESIGTGITNHNFKVVVGGVAFVVRIAGKDTDLLGIDRRVELDASLAAAELGIGPEVVAFLEPEGYLVTRFVEGEVGRFEVAEAAALLRRFHDGRGIAGRFDSFRVVEGYASFASERGVTLPPAYERARELAVRIEARRGPYTLRPCHDDLLAANFVHDGEQLRIVDWEYAGMGDPAFDLANFAVNNGLDEEGDRALLEAYGGGDLDVHVVMRFMSDFREATWALVQQAVSQLEFDFVVYGEEHFERLERTAAEPRFRRALG